MPNHLRALNSFFDTGKNINRIAGNGKRFMAYDLVKKLKNTNKEIILQQLSDCINASDKKRGKLHEAINYIKEKSIMAFGLKYMKPKKPFWGFFEKGVKKIF